MAGRGRALRLFRDDLAALATLVRARCAANGGGDAPRLVLLVLALRLFADGDGRSWPATATLAALVGLPHRCAVRLIDRAEALGLVRVEPRPGRSSVLRLAPALLATPAGDGMTSDESAPAVAGTGGQGSTPAGRGTRAGSGTRASRSADPCQTWRRPMPAPASERVEERKTTELHPVPLKGPAPRASRPTPPRTPAGAVTLKKLKASERGRALLARAVAAGIEPREFVEALIADRGTDGRAALPSPLATFAAALDLAEAVPS